MKKIFTILLLSFIARYAYTQQKAALVIGNNNYKDYPLKNAANDADLMAATLRKLGFAVTEVKDAGKTEFDRALLNFNRANKDAAIRFFYYAGHGLQFEGENYLVPVDAVLENKEDVQVEGISFGTVTNMFQNSKPDAMNIFVVDACRNNPFKNRSWGNRDVAGDRGLVLKRDEFHAGSFAAFSADNGQKASDGEKGNGLYTFVLADEIQKPGEEISIIFRHVRSRVLAASNNEQLPVEENRLTGDAFYFVPGSTPVPVVVTPNNPVAPPIQPPAVVPGLENMVFVEGGTFNMGSATSDALDNEKPVHQVTVSSFYISKYLVTQAQWQAVMGNNPSEHKCDNCPVENITWDDAKAYCRKKSSETGKTYRLPTEAEWEYAARGGNKSNGYIYSGSNNIDEIGWHESNSGGTTHPVGQKQPNELGLYAMTGNVWEWCSDWLDVNYYSSSPAQNPQGASTGSGPTGPGRVMRGGSWDDPPRYCRAADRNGNAPDNLSSDLGFRPVVSF